MCKAAEQLRTEPQNWKLFITGSSGGLLHLPLAPRPPLHCATLPMSAKLFFPTSPSPATSSKTAQKMYFQP